jgi:hypothetical protein
MPHMYTIFFTFKGYRPDMNYSDRWSVEASHVFEAKEKFFRTHDKDHFFIDKILDERDYWL